MNNFLVIIFVIAFILAAGAVGLIYYKKPKKSGVSDVEFKKLWTHVESLIKADDHHQMVQALVEADKLMDMVLKKKVKGDDLGGRLRKAKGLFTAEGYSRVWNAHKLRNRLVHEVGVKVSMKTCRMAVGDFSRGFRDLGYKF